MEARGRGRGKRGRGEGQMSGQQQPQQQRPAGAWGQRPPQTQQQQGPPPQQQPQQGGQPQGAWLRPPAPSAVSGNVGGRGSRPQEGGDVAGAVIEQQMPRVTGVGDGGSLQASGGGVRGAPSGGVRGRPTRADILMTRPKNIQNKQGSSGRPINLMANYFQLLHAGKWALYQYRVDFSPAVDATSTRKFLMRTGMREVIKGGYLFDGTVMYTPQRIQDNLEVFVKNDAEENIRITCRLVGDVAWGDYHYIQLFNLIIRKCFVCMQFQLLGRNYFDAALKTTIPEFKLELWPGFTTSMRQHEKDILLNVDVSSKVMRTDTVLDLFSECMNSRNPKAEFQERVIGNVVLTFYNNKTYRIDDVDFSMTPESTFAKRDGEQISYMEYYKKKYNVNIRQRSQPMLISRSKPREIRAGMPETVILVPELCQMTGLTDKQRENFHLMKALAEHTRIGPQKRIQKLVDFAKRLNGCPQAVEELKRWDLKLANTLLQIPGRILPEEKILLGDNVQVGTSGDKANWTTGFRNNSMFEGYDLKCFIVIVPNRLRPACNEFLQTLQRVIRGFKWNVGPPKIMEIRDDRTNSYLEAIEAGINQYNPQLAMIILPQNSSDRYSAIKKKCCVDRALPSQVVLAKNLTAKGVMSIATKIAVQMNCKIGGAPWSVHMPLSNTMIVGYDVCRDTAKRGTSFGAFVASINRQITRYFAHTIEHQVEEELSDHFATFMVLACHEYKKVNGAFPERILIYRDGVGDGQIPYVYEQEVGAIKKKLVEEIYQSTPLRMAFVIVSKRIGTRVFAGEYNPPPGTVIDDVITLPERYDFFIVSQCVLQGSVSPTSYNVIEDTLGLPPDRMQMLTYKLCHMYFNWSGTVRVPAPCQYAHKLAFLTAQSLHRPAHRQLAKTLFYL